MRMGDEDKTRFQGYVGVDEGSLGAAKRKLGT